MVLSTVLIDTMKVDTALVYMSLLLRRLPRLVRGPKGRYVVYLPGPIILPSLWIAVSTLEYDYNMVYVGWSISLVIAEY